MKRTLRAQAAQLMFSFVLASLAVVGTGCTHATMGTLSRQFEFRVQRVPAFMMCLDEPGGSCKVQDASKADVDFFSADRFEGSITPLDTSTTAPNDSKGADPARVATSAIAGLAREVLNHDVQKQINAIFDIARGVAPGDTVAARSTGLMKFSQHKGSTAVSIDLDRAKFEDYERDIEAATRLGAWDALAKEADLSRASDESARRVRYIKSYFEAYFRQGRFFKVTVDPSELRSKLIAETKKVLPGPLMDESYEELADRMFPRFNFNADTGYVFGAIQDEGFVTRGGQAVRFPAIEIATTLGTSQVTANEVNYVAVGSDLIRVLLHAIFDSEMQLPAVSNATGIGVTPGGLAVNDGTVVDPYEFERVETLAAQAEGVVAAGTGRLLRGISFFSLNNEALASAIETAVGVAVRKQAEKAVWCWYACGFNEVKRGVPDAGDYTALGYGDSIQLTISIAGVPGFRVSGESHSR